MSLFINDNVNMLVENELGNYNFCIPSLVSDDVLKNLHVGHLAQFRSSAISKKLVILLGHLCRKTIERYNGKDDSFIPLSSRWLRKILGERYQAPIVRSLVATGIMEINPSYWVGHYCKAYRIRPAWLEQGFRAVKLSLRNRAHPTEPDYNARLKNLLRDENNLIRLTTENLLKLNLPSFKDVPQGDLKPRQKAYLERRLENLENRRIYCLADDFGRLHNNFTSLNRVARVLCLLDNEPLVSVDIKACFPTLLVSLIEDSREKAKYMDWLFKSDFYRELMARDSTLKNRDSVKKQFNSWLNGEWRCEAIERVMSQEFPILYIDLCQIKWRDKVLVGHKLMRLEGNIMLNGAMTHLWHQDSSLPLLSLHDAIYCPKDHAERVAETITEFFLIYLDFKPRLEISDNG